MESKRSHVVIDLPVVSAPRIDFGFLPKEPWSKIEKALLEAEVLSEVSRALNAWEYTREDQK